MLSIRYNSRIKSGKNKRATQIIAKTKSYIDKYNWKGINYPSEKDDWEKIEIILRLLLTLCMLKRKNITCLCCKT